MSKYFSSSIFPSPFSGMNFVLTLFPLPLLKKGRKTWGFFEATHLYHLVPTSSAQSLSRLYLYSLASPDSLRSLWGIPHRPPCPFFITSLPFVLLARIIAYHKRGKLT